MFIIIFKTNSIMYRIDQSRHLCTNCKKKELEKSCEESWFEIGEEGNIFRCLKHQKIKKTIKNWRAKKGDIDYSYTLENEKVSMKKFKPNRRGENETRIDDLYHEIGNISNQKKNV